MNKQHSFNISFGKSRPRFCPHIHWYVVWRLRTCREGCISDASSWTRPPNTDSTCHCKHGSPSPHTISSTRLQSLPSTIPNNFTQLSFSVPIHVLGAPPIKVPFDHYVLLIRSAFQHWNYFLGAPIRNYTVLLASTWNNSFVSTPSAYLCSTTTMPVDKTVSLQARTCLRVAVRC